jgi:hypothetical protein
MYTLKYDMEKDKHHVSAEQVIILVDSDAVA